MKRLLYLIGPPGVGKTTALDAALAGVHRYEQSHPFAFQCYSVRGENGNFSGAQLGGRRASFGGTDTLPMNVQPKVVEWLGRTPIANIAAEGDRLGNAKFFDAVVAQGWELTVCWLEAPWAVCQARRDGRGSSQNETWLKGRHSKVERLAVNWCSTAWVIDGCASVEAVAARLREHPVVRAIRGEV